MRSVPLACAALAVISMCGVASAAERHPGSAGVRFAGAPATAARTWLDQSKESLRLHGAAFAHRATLPVFGSHTVRLQQTHGGLPVFGTMIAVRVAPDGEIKQAVLDVARDLTVSTVPMVDEASARGLVAGWSGRPVAFGAWTELGVVPTSSGGRLIWRVNVPRNDGAYRYELDAHTGQFLREYSLAQHIKGRVYEVNNVQTPTATDKDLLNLAPSTPQVLACDAELVARYVSGDLESQTPNLVVDKNAVQPSDTTTGDFLYDPVTGWQWDDAFTEVNVYYHLDRMRTFYQTTLGVEMTGGQWRLLAIPHYGPGHQVYQNAFYSPSSISESGVTYNNIIAIGGLTNYNFAYDSDVFLHEYTHYVNQRALDFAETQFMSDEYGMNLMPMALNEGSADYFSCTLNDQAVVGEASLSYSKRDLSLTQGTCPDSLTGESHGDGQLMARTAWAARTAIGKELADPLVWGAMSMLTPSSLMGDFGTQLLAGAQELKTAGKITDAQVTAIQDAIHTHGLDDCGRFLAIDVDKSRLTNMLGFDWLAAMYGFGGSCANLKNYGIEFTSMFQFTYAAKPTDKVVRFHVDLAKTFGTATYDWDIYVRKGDGVTFQSQGMGGIELDQYDYKVTGITTTQGDITIDANSNPPLDPSGTYYMVILERNCASTKATIKLFNEAVTPDAGPEASVDAEPDAGEVDAAEETGEEQPVVTDDGSAEGGGCGCRTSGGSQAGRFAALALIGAAALLRRRR